MNPTPQSPQKPLALRGFSLIELVMVLAILAVVAAIAVPRYAQSMDRYRVDLSAQRLVADLAYAQSEARRTSSARTVTFTVASDTYVIAGVADFKNDASNYAVVLSDSPYQASLTSATFDDPVVVDDPLNEVIFDGYGRPDSGGTVQIASGGVTRQVVLDPETGKAVVQ